mmetsp:Transcript_28622/g.39545  ORF Transcript_28622/g.39545 Transcript_28622/m.39545 type:complete len:310 (-) Transcript_28622:88-1017(-)
MSSDELIVIKAEVAGLELTVARRNLESENFVDPYFFDEDYSLAGTTGFQVWDGTWLFLELLGARILTLGERADQITSQASLDQAALEQKRARAAAEIREKLGPSFRLKGQKVVEVGAGIGLAGLAAAAVGAHVMQTDLSAVVHGALGPNLARNIVVPASQDVVVQNQSGNVRGDLGTLQPSQNWEGATRLGEGSVALMPLDWCKPNFISSNVDLTDADIILAIETVWLSELIQPFVSVVVSLLKGKRQTICYFINGERATETSTTFAKMSDVLSAFEAEGCQCDFIGEAPTEDTLKPIKFFILRASSLS